MSTARNPRQPRGVPRVGRTLPVPPLRDLTDDELTAVMDDDAEAAYEALHAPCNLVRIMDGDGRPVRSI